MGKRITTPVQRNYERALSEALEIALNRLAIVDIRDRCRKSGARLPDSDVGKSVEIEYCGQDYRLTLPSAEVVGVNNSVPLPPREQLLVLHYFLNADGNHPDGKLITLKEIPDGLNYFPTFSKRALAPIRNAFGKDPDLLVKAGKQIGGVKTDFGDAAFKMDVFACIPLTFVVWRGDEEFGPEANILFDRNITDYLPVEDIIVMSEIIAWKLVRIKGT